MAYSFNIYDQWGLISIEFRGELVGAETDEAILTILRDMPLLERRNITRIGIDWRKVSAASLLDTDGAKVKNSAKRLKAILEINSEEYAKFLENLFHATLIDPSTPVAEILIERLSRVRPNYSEQVMDLQRVHRSAELPQGVCMTQKQYLQLLNLPPNFDLSD